MKSVSRLQTLGAYTLGERLGVGGMAEVFAAHSPDCGSVALKRILPGLAEDKDFSAMFWDEARITSRLDHANIVRILDYGCVDSQLYMALEYIDGPTLARVLRRAAKARKPLSLPVLVGVILQLLDALEYVHSAKDERGRPLRIVHRDVSPGNVMLTRTGDTKLGDFGIVRSMAVARRTQPGELKGKIGYMSPEQASGDTVTRQSDVFSVGIILAEFLTLRPLFLGKTEMQTLTRTLNVDLSTWDRYKQGVPNSLKEVVETALRKELSERYSSAKEMRAALLNVARSSGWTLERGAVEHELRGLSLIGGEERSGERLAVRVMNSESATEEVDAATLAMQSPGTPRRPQGRPVWDTPFTQVNLPMQLFLALRRAWNGWIELSENKDSLVLEVEQGRIVSTYDSTGRNPIGRILYEASVIRHTELALAIGESRRASLRLGEYLVLHGKLRESTLQRLLRQQMEARLSPWFNAEEGKLAVFVRDEQGRPDDESARSPASLAEVVSVMRGALGVEELSRCLEAVMTSIALPARDVPLTVLGLTEPESRAVRTTMDGGAYEGRVIGTVISNVVHERIARKRESMFALVVCLSAGIIQAPGFGR